MRWLLLPVGLVAAAAGAVAILGQAGSGAQPWDLELSDNFVFVKAIPFALALGVALGLARAGGQRTQRTQRRADGAIRRFAPGTVAAHWLIALGFLLALPTGVWQYLGGILDVHAPVPLYLIYRIHYIGATVILFVLASFLTYWWANGDRSLLVSRGQWRRHLVGLAHELPPRLGALLARRLRLDLRSARPETGKFTFYEIVVSFPTWTFVLALITITGLLKAMRYVYPIPGPLLFWASTLHVVAMVLIVIKVLDHLRYTFARWPLLSAMTTTWLSERYARLWHPGWREVSARDSDGRVAAAGAATGGDE